MSNAFVHSNSDSDNNDNDNDNDRGPIGAAFTGKSGKKRSVSSRESCAFAASVSSRKRQLREDAKTKNAPGKGALRPEGCMLNPRQPIKMFATDRDKATRRSLRRSLKQQRNNNIDIDNNNNIDNNNDEVYRNHWSVLHCWTFREMLGFDRFSGLLTETQADLVANDDAVVSEPDSNRRQRGSGVGIDWIFVTTYILDVDYLLNELPELLEIPSVVIVYQYKDFGAREEAWITEVSRKRGHNLVLLERNPQNQPRSQTNPLKAQMAYGCHHTKMTLVGYSSGRLRVHVHTSNLRREDVHDKCQGAFLQDFVPKNDDQLSNFVTSDFEESLVTYLESYDFVLPLVWNQSTTPPCGEDHEATTLVSHLQTYDFSTAVGVLIPSVPGYHRETLAAGSRDGDEVYGYLKVQKAIREHCNNNSSSNNNDNDNDNDNEKKNENENKKRRPGPIVCQFSSMGALWEPYLDTIATAWNVETCSGEGTATGKPKKGERTASLLRFVWPTTREITESVEGPAGGASVPGTAKNLHKTFLRPLLHRWKSGGPSNERNRGTTESHHSYHRQHDPLDKGRHVPHIKSYYQIMCAEPYSAGSIGDDGNDNADNADNDMLWFVLSSHNLSVAAWGQVQNRSRDLGRDALVIRHWELGVFLAPRTLGVDAMGSIVRREGDDPPRDANRAIVPLPYKFRPDPYRDSDQPWVVG